jgi:broad specificity phosphatase PhoE
LQLKDDSFDVLFVSPLQRAKQTADIVAAGRDLPTTMLPGLREIDLYSFQVCTT